MRSAVSSFFVHSPPDGLAQVQVLAEDTALCSWARQFTLSTQRVSLMLEQPCDMPFMGGVQNTPSRSILQKAEISAEMI